MLWNLSHRPVSNIVTNTLGWLCHGAQHTLDLLGKKKKKIATTFDKYRANIIIALLFNNRSLPLCIRLLDSWTFKISDAGILTL